MTRASRHQEALESIQQTLALQPDNAQALYNQGVILHKLARLEEALASYDRAVRADPYSAESWNNRGSVLQELRRREDALTSYDRALALKPDHAKAWNNRGLVLHDMRRLEESLASYDRALALNPNYAQGWNNRSTTLLRMGRPQDALASAERALELSPDIPEAMYNLGCALCENNRIAEGFAAFTRFSKVKSAQNTPQNESAAKARAKHDAEQDAYIAAMGEGSGERLACRAINDADVPNIERHWRANHPQVVTIDNFLNPEALDKLRHFCLGAKIWNKTYKGGYLGAFRESGFGSPLLAQIAEELRLTYPAIFGAHSLRNAWAFKYDSDLSGIRIHADQAAVNVNFWITPDEANLNPDNGGLVIWDAAAPLDWHISRYNGDDDACREYLARAKSRPTTVPYRANRAVIFDSDLFHETDRFEFKDGYENRRINVTLLYGERSANER